jgi:hypothetical protein
MKWKLSLDYGSDLIALDVGIYLQADGPWKRQIAHCAIVKWIQGVIDNSRIIAN